MSDRTSTLAAGQEIAGANHTYRLLEILGKGGFGRVWKASRQAVLGTTEEVAIKEQWDNPSENVPQAIERERTSLQKLAEVPQVPAFIEEVKQEQGYALIVMELVPGKTADKHFADKNLSPDEYKTFLLNLLKLFSLIHKKKVLHRDLKPNNIVIHRDTGLPWIVDFGIAKEIPLCKKGGNTIVGTELFCAPEVKMEVVSKASDVYSIGATLLYLTHSAKTSDTMWKQVVPRCGFGEPLNTVLTRMVELQPTRRCQTCDEAIGLLTSFEVTFKQSGVPCVRRCQATELFCHVSAAVKLFFEIPANSTITYYNSKNESQIKDNQPNATCLEMGIRPGDWASWDIARIENGS